MRKLIGAIIGILLISGAIWGAGKIVDSKKDLHQSQIA